MPRSNAADTKSGRTQAAVGKTMRDYARGRGYEPWLVEMFKRATLVVCLRPDRYLRPYATELSRHGIYSMADLVDLTPEELFEKVPASPRIQKRVLAQNLPFKPLEA